jgi:16S rRNA A1518/A1519 N6-dimethyltransferase RsmA/KsgA/DIM1 with predicted DNA glycosylase/AP lyase activity
VTVFRNGIYGTDSITIPPNDHVDVDCTTWYRCQIFYNMQNVGTKLLYFISENRNLFEELVLPLTESEVAEYITAKLGEKYCSGRVISQYRPAVFDLQDGTYVHKRYSNIIQHFPLITNHCA